MENPSDNATTVLRPRPVSLCGQGGVSDGSRARGGLALTSVIWVLWVVVMERRYGPLQGTESSRLTPYRGTGGIFSCMPAFTIGNLARAAGVSVETVRYYERRGLLERPVRHGSEYREYSEGDVTRLRFIRRAKTLGFTLAEIRELLPSAATGCVGEVLTAARAKLAQVDADIAERETLRTRLARLVDACAGGSDDCVTLDIATG